MKNSKLFKTMIPFLLSVMLILFSCEAFSGTNIKPKHQNTFEGRHTPDYTFTGKVEFWNNAKAKEFGLFFADPQGKYHYIMVENTTLSATISDGIYYMELYQHGLVLISQSDASSKWFIGLKNESSTDLLHDLKDDTAFKGSSLTGTSLLHKWGTPSVFNHQTMAVAKAKYSGLGLMLSVSGTVCNSGGEGAASSSQASSDGGSSVSCASGYYACCYVVPSVKVADCKCLKEEL